jgi:hypothetical protein
VPSDAVYSFGHPDDVVFKEVENRFEYRNFRTRSERGLGDVKATPLKCSLRRGLEIEGASEARPSQSISGWCFWCVPDCAALAL